MVFVELFALLVIVSGASWVLSWGAERLVERYGANFVGSVLLALITTLPEYMFVYFACLKDRYEVAIGSAIGSCSILITLGYGMVILVSTTRMSRRPVQRIALSAATQVDALYLLLTAVVALGLVWWGDGLSLTDAFSLTLLLVAYILNHWRRARAHSIALAEKEDAPPAFDWKAWVAIAVAGAVIVAVSNPFVDAMIGAATAMKISPVIIALILGPIASEMPEKLTAFVTVRRDGALAEIAVCNFIGSKVNHNSLLLAVIPFVAYFQHGRYNVPGLLTPAFLLMTGLSVIATVSLARRRLELWQGLVFLGLYGVVLYAAFTGFAPLQH